MSKMLWIVALFALAIVQMTPVNSIAHAQDDNPATVRANSREVQRDGRDAIEVDIVVENVENLGAFEFVLAFDGGVLELVPQGVVRADFLGSSGREVFCPDPVIEPSVLRFSCGTLGDDPPEGATGSGTIASVFFLAKNNGRTEISFSRARLATPDAIEIPAEWVSGPIEVNAEVDGGLPGWAWIAGAVAVATVLAAVGAAWRRSRA